jgi:serine/threonine protein kinase
MFFDRFFKKKVKKEESNPPTSNLGSFKTGDVISIESFGNMRFRVGQIMHGGMGIVYQLITFDEAFAYRAAKILLPGINQKIFKREAENWFNLGEHNNIAQPLWFGIWEENCCILMRWYEESLQSLNPYAMQLTDIYRIIIGTLKGLEHALQKSNLVHQDILQIF